MTEGWARGSRGVWWLANAVALLAVARLAGLRLNLTGSLPIGLYVEGSGEPAPGTLVLVCLPPRVAAFALARGYVSRGGSCPGGVVPIGKRVVAVAGDTVSVTPNGLLVNGAPVPNSKALVTDRHGRPLPQLHANRYAVRPGTAWILSSYSPLSFDSRYFGPISVAQVRARLGRVWTAGPNP